MPLKNWCLTHARWSKSSLKHSIRFCGIFPTLKQNSITYRSSKVSSRSDCIFEIHHLWQSGFSRVFSNCCCSCSFEAEIIKIVQSSHKMYSNNILNFQESTILHACTKKSGNLLNAPSKLTSAKHWVKERDSHSLSPFEMCQEKIFSSSLTFVLFGEVCTNFLKNSSDTGEERKKLWNHHSCRKNYLISSCGIRSKDMYRNSCKENTGVYWCHDPNIDIWTSVPSETRFAW